MAENLQTVLYLCPHCKESGKLTSKGKYLSCSCGSRWEFTPFGKFAPAEPFENIAQWDAWQQAELARLDLVLQDADVTLRCNIVTLSDEENYEDKTMVDYSAGDISSEEAAELIKSVQAAFGNETYTYYSGVSYRHCLIWKDAP